MREVLPLAPGEVGEPLSEPVASNPSSYFRLGDVIEGRAKSLTRERFLSIYFSIDSPSCNGLSSEPCMFMASLWLGVLLLDSCSFVLLNGTSLVAS